MLPPTRPNKEDRFTGQQAQVASMYLRLPRAFLLWPAQNVFDGGDPSIFTLVQSLLLDDFLCLADGAGLQLWWGRVEGQGKLNLAGKLGPRNATSPRRDK